MSESQSISGERRALEAMLRLLDAAEECRRLHAAAQLEVPLRLRRFLGESSVNGALSGPTSPPEPPRPSGVDDDAIWVAATECTAAILTLAVLRESGKPMRARDVVDGVLRANPEINSGSVLNLAARLDGTAITRDEHGWTLVSPSSSPTLFKGNVWGRTQMFTKQELAAHRRNGIVHILRTSADGLQVMQLVRTLESCPWQRAPMNKDLVKTDLQVLLDGGVVRRVGNSKKWLAT